MYVVYIYIVSLCTLLSTFKNNLYIKSTALDGFEEEEECLAQAVYEQLQLDENPVVKEDSIHCYFFLLSTKMRDMHPYINLTFIVFVLCICLDFELIPPC